MTDQRTEATEIGHFTYHGETVRLYTNDGGKSFFIEGYYDQPTRLPNLTLAQSLFQSTCSDLLKRTKPEDVEHFLEQQQA